MFNENAAPPHLLINQMCDMPPLLLHAHVHPQRSDRTFSLWQRFRSHPNTLRYHAAISWSIIKSYMLKSYMLKSYMLKSYMLKSYMLKSYMLKSYMLDRALGFWRWSI